jgi:hypothetical protein
MTRGPMQAVHNIEHYIDRDLDWIEENQIDFGISFEE